MQQVQGQSIKLLLTPKEAATALSIGLTYLYALLAQERIMSVKVGRLRRIPVHALEVFVQELSHDQAGQ